MNEEISHTSAAVVKETSSESRSDSDFLLQNFSNETYLDYSKNLLILSDDLVALHPDSHLRPKLWPVSTKIRYTISYGFVTFAAQFNSTTMSSEYFVEKMKTDYHVGREVTLLATTLYLLGIAFGPMIFAPISEKYGRKFGVLPPFFISILLTFATLISYNVPSIMITRFLSGFFAGAPIVSSGGVMSDLWEPSQRGAAFALYSCFVANGASFGPTIGSLLIHSNSSNQSWRIPQWFIGLVDLALLSYVVMTTTETFEPVILKKLAKHEWIFNKRWSIHSKLDGWELDWKEIVVVHFYRPFFMLTIPIVFVVALFASYVYGLFYLMITNLSQAFEISREWEGTIATLPNVSLFLGVFLGCIANMLWAFHYGKLIMKNDGRAIPEQRFPIMMLLGWLIPAGIFLFGWSSYSYIYWVVPCVGIVLIGCGFITIFQGCLNYLVDAYPTYSASVIAANTFLGSCFAAGFPLFAKQLFVNLGVHWGSSLIGFIALGMIPIPFVLFIYGSKIRDKGTSKLSG